MSLWVKLRGRSLAVLFGPLWKPQVKSDVQSDCPHETLQSHYCTKCPDENSPGHSIYSLLSSGCADKFFVISSRCVLQGKFPNIVSNFVTDFSILSMRTEVCPSLNTLDKTSHIPPRIVATAPITVQTISIIFIVRYSFIIERAANIQRKSIIPRRNNKFTSHLQVFPHQPATLFAAYSVKRERSAYESTLSMVVVGDCFHKSHASECVTAKSFKCRMLGGIRAMRPPWNLTNIKLDAQSITSPLGTGYLRIDNQMSTLREKQ